MIWWINKGIDKNMSLDNRTRNKRRDLPRLDLTCDIDKCSDHVGRSTRTMKGVSHREINSPSSSDIQDRSNRAISPEIDYVETAYRYMAAGSPTPEPGQEVQDPDNPDDVHSTHLGQHRYTLHHEPRSGNRKYNTNIGTRQHSTPTAAIKIASYGSRAREHDHDLPEPEDSDSDVINSGESPRRRIESPNPSTLLLTPTPPLCRKREKNKIMTYYQPALTGARSEGSIRDAVQRYHSPIQVSTERLTIGTTRSRNTSRSHGNIRTHTVGSPISISNTHMLLSPVSPTRQTLMGSFPGDSNHRQSDDFSTKMSPISTPSPSVSPIGSPAGRWRPGIPSYCRDYGELQDGQLPKI